MMIQHPEVTLFKRSMCWQDSSKQSLSVYARNMFNKTATDNLLQNILNNMHREPSKGFLTCYLLLQVTFYFAALLLASYHSTL